MHITGAGVAEADGLLESLTPAFQPPAAWRARSEALRNLSKLAPAPVPPPLAALLRPYQRLGVAWLWHLYRHELGGVLADEMGLGKTFAGAGTDRRASRGEARNPDSKSDLRSPVWSSAPPRSWKTGGAKRPGSRPGCGPSRITATGGRIPWPRSARADLVIASYGTLVRDRALFESAEFTCVIGDEAQHIKNRRTQHAQALRALRARGRFLLTGTPIENSLDDLRSLFDFLMPGYLALAAGRGARRGEGLV